MTKALMEMAYRLLLGLRKARTARFLVSNRCDRWIHSQGWEPEVLKCLCEGRWNGPVWDVGAALGKHAHQVAQYHTVYAFEPNLNMLYYLGWNLRQCARAILVPCALTLDGKCIQGNVDPDFLATPTGPKVATLSLKEAMEKFGRPGVIKIDIEGEEYSLIKSPLLVGIPLVIEWHGEIPHDMDHWHVQKIDATHTLLLPK